MKRTSLFALAVFGMVLISLSGCKKSSNNSNPSGQYMTVNLGGGQSFSATSFIATNSASDGSLNLYGIKINGTDTLAMSISISDSLAVGEPGPVVGGELVTYGAYNTFIGGFTNDSSLWVENDIAGPGSLTLTSWDTTTHTVAGTFWGTLYAITNSDSLVMTGGKFNVTYINVP
jgi:hypothetical protein